MFGQYKKQTKLWEGILTGKEASPALAETQRNQIDTSQVVGVARSSDQKQLDTVLSM